MSTPLTQSEKVKLGAEDAWPYFRYMTDFVGFTPEDAKTIRASGLIIEKYIPDIVAAFYAHILHYPPTRKHFLKKDGTIDQDYLQKRMHHLTNFWRRTAAGQYDEEYARYVDYVGRAHTSHGADPNIYIAERYVIGQVGFMQNAITTALIRELHEYDPELEESSVRAWNMLMMIILEMLARAYREEHELEGGEGAPKVDKDAIRQLAIDTYEAGLGLGKPILFKDVNVARVDEIPNGERKIVQVDDLSIGVFHHKGQWFAVRNHCLHRGGPVATGCLEGDTLTCPWHGYQYDVTTGRLLVDPTTKLETYPITILADEIHLQVPETQGDTTPVEPQAPAAKPALQENQFHAAELAPGQARLVHLDGVPVAVFNVDGSFFATQNNCTHVGGPLSEGALHGSTVICPWHGSCFNVTTGEVECGPAKKSLQTFVVTVLDGIVTVESA